MKSCTSDESIVLALRAISGEITPDMRLIAFQLQEDRVVFRFYLEHEVTELVRECAEIIAVNFDAGFPRPLKALDLEFVVTTKPLGHLDALDFGIFRRWEDVSSAS